MDISATLGIVGAVLGIAGVAGASTAVLRSNMAQSTAKLWQGEAEALKARANRLEEELKQARADHLICKERLDAVEEKAYWLEGVVRESLSIYGSPMTPIKGPRKGVSRETP